jgi:hypothetical protein
VDEAQVDKVFIFFNAIFENDFWKWNKLFLVWVEEMKLILSFKSSKILFCNNFKILTTWLPILQRWLNMQNMHKWYKRRKKEMTWDVMVQVIIITIGLAYRVIN